MLHPQSATTSEPRPAPRLGVAADLIAGLVAKIGDPAGVRRGVAPRLLRLRFGRACVRQGLTAGHKVRRITALREFEYMRDGLLDSTYNVRPESACERAQGRWSLRLPIVRQRTVPQQDTMCVKTRDVRRFLVKSVHFAIAPACANHVDQRHVECSRTSPPDSTTHTRKPSWPW
jgi:hypothetical protein